MSEDYTKSHENSLWSLRCLAGDDRKISTRVVCTWSMRAAVGRRHSIVASLRRAHHIEEGYEDRGVSKSESERRAWATVNKESHGGKKSGSGRGHSESHESLAERRTS